MSHVEETTQELNDPCTFCGEGETCCHGDGCSSCCLDCRREEDKQIEKTLRFDQGWNAAIARAKEKIEGYIAAQREGQPVDPWEEWLPRLLTLLAER